ncbi:MAG: PKD domain-containing protein [Holophagales bacterium]|nr:PKD domain-containing protein [Holophagales bacterium]
MHAQGGSVATDKAALEALYAATGGASWTFSTNWNSNAPLGSWYGVSTDANGRVIQVVLQFNNLRGDLPNALGDLSELQYLVLGSNGLTGSIPASLGNLTRLLTLALSENGLTGSIPAELGGLSSLRSLQLGDNRLSGSIPTALGNPPALWALSLEGNLLTGGIPTELATAGLQFLDLSRNDLTGSIPGEFGSVATLTTLSLGGNSLTGVVPAALANAGALEKLDFSFNFGLSGALPSGLANLSDLSELDIHGTALCAPADSAFQTWLSTITFHSSGRVCGTDPVAQPTIDVAVFYTPGAREAAGGQSGIESVIDLMVAETNQAYMDGGVQQRIALVAREETAYVESTSSLVDLTRFTRPADGHMDEVHVIRDIVGADLVHLIVGRATVGGVTWPVPRADRAFGLTRHNGGGVFFAHELGHNMGLSHDRYVQCQTASCGSTPHQPYGFGYVNQQAFVTGAPASARWRTIMSYENQCFDEGVACELLLRFSSPSQTRGGDALGVQGERDAPDLAGPADAVRVLGEMRHTVAAFREKRTAPDPDHAPTPVGTLADRSLLVGDPAVVVDVSGAFQDPDGDALTYEAFSSAETVATAVLSGTAVTLTAIGPGRATVTVTATDAAGSNGTAWQSFTVLVDGPTAIDYDADDDGLIEIRTLGQLNVMRADPFGTGDPGFAEIPYAAAFPDRRQGMGCAAGLCSGYELVADLDFDTNGSGGPDAGDAYWNGGAGWAPLGTFFWGPFAATFDGNGHQISNLFIDRGGHAALFDVVAAGATVRSVGVARVDVTGSRAAGLAVRNRGVIANSYVTGRVAGRLWAGGLVEENRGTIASSRASGQVTSSNQWAGGLVAQNYGQVTGSFAASQVTATDPATGSAGGLVGTNGAPGAAGTIETSYATGRADAPYQTGGLAALNAGRIANSYAAVLSTGASTSSGGLVGRQHAATVPASYWDTDASGRQNSRGGTGRTTAQLQAPIGYTGIYADWDVDLDGDGMDDEPWDFGTDSQYAVLKANVDGQGGATWREFGYQLREGPTLSVTDATERAALSWTPVDTSHWTSPPPVTYRAIRVSGTGSRQVVETLADGLSGRSYTDTNAVVGTTYYYQVAAVIDGGEAARSALVEVTIRPSNSPPQPVGSIATHTLRVGDGHADLDVSAGFHDPDGDALTYGAGSSAPGVAGTQVLGNLVRLTPVAAGSATITVTATDVAGTNMAATQQFVVTVTPPRSVTVTPPSLAVTEGSSARYSVVLGSQPSGNVEVRVLNDLAGTDLSVNPAALTFTETDWSTPKEIEVTAADDPDAVADARVTLLHGVSGADYGSVSAAGVEVTILENDTPTLSTQDAAAGESEGSMTFTVRLSVASSSEVTVDYATSDGAGAQPAAAGSDYTAVQGTLTFPQSSTAARDIVVPLLADTVDEAEQETFRLTLRNPVNAVLAGGGSTLQVEGTIRDDDDPEVTVSFGAASYEVTEGDSVNVAVRLDRDPERAVVVPLERTHHGGATEADYSGIPSSVAFGPGVVTQEFVFSATDDGADDDGEAVELRFGPMPPRVSGGAGATLAIRDNDSTGGGGGPSPPPDDGDDEDDEEEDEDSPPPPSPPRLPTMSVSAAQAVESAGAVVFDVHLSRASSSLATVDYATSDGAGASGARAGSDYTATRGTLTFPSGSTARRIRVPVRDDGVYEAASETFFLTLQRPVNATLAGGGSALRVLGTIHDDDDGPPMVTFEVVGATCDEELCRTRTGVPVRFIDTSTGKVLSRLWEFGDGKTSRSRRVEHAWSSPGFYEVTLSVSDGATTSTASRVFLVEAAEPQGTCVADAETLCLQDSRYSVSVEWRTGGEGGAGLVVPAGTNDSGMFYFFHAGNWEVLIKVLDGCAVNGHVWVYTASTTDLGYTIRVTDTVTGVAKDYGNDPGLPAPAITDATAFPEGCRR